MNDWKNPTWGKDNRKEWNPPISNEDEDVDNLAMGIALVIKAIIGFILIATINGVALMFVMNLLNVDVSYRNAVAIGAIYVCWRAYDKVVFARFKN